MTTPEEHLAPIRERAEAATEGPWVAEYSGEQGNCVIPHDAQSTREAVAITRLYHQQADAEFIAHARQDIPRLLAALDATLRIVEAPEWDGFGPFTNIRAAITAALEDQTHGG